MRELSNNELMDIWSKRHPQGKEAKMPTIEELAIAKEETIERWTAIRDLTYQALIRASEYCSYCRVSDDNNGCDACPANPICLTPVHTEATTVIAEAYRKVSALVDAVKEIPEGGE